MLTGLSEWKWPFALAGILLVDAKVKPCWKQMIQKSFRAYVPLAYVEEEVLRNCDISSTVKNVIFGSQSESAAPVGFLW